MATVDTAWLRLSLPELADIRLQLPLSLKSCHL